jgi:hypothetical protein
VSHQELGGGLQAAHAIGVLLEVEARAGAEPVDELGVGGCATAQVGLDGRGLLDRRSGM